MAAMFDECGSSSSSSYSWPAGWNYDVFLSFRGEDTRTNFCDHLYSALVNAGIHTFRDDEELPRGKEISPQLREAIQGSRISLVVFSKGYASSRWCLDELAEIIECKRKFGQVVLPIFYGISPSDVRKQEGSFAEAFDRHEERFNKEKVDKWREALTEAADLSGCDLTDLANGYESKFIQAIVKGVSEKLDGKYLYVGNHLVGIDSHVEKITDLLSIDTKDVHIMGIHGIGGIGKTTLAKVLYNKLIHGFEGHCFLSDVRDTAAARGLVHLQEKLLNDIVRPNTWNINDVDRGKNVIKERLCCKRVLVVLDDVDETEQLKTLVGERSWFGPGSKIIITTRNERLLTEHEADEKYHLTELNQNESLQLFSWHAFKRAYPLEDYVELAASVVRYCGGHPLALEVLGSHLFRRSNVEWSTTIEKLQKIPDHKIQEKLRISYDTLDDHLQKSIFLDIACFFVGMDIGYVTRILDTRGFYPGIGISILIERSLVTVDNQNKLNMHGLIRDMGRDIVRSPHGRPGEHSRIWDNEDSWDVLNDHTGTQNVEGLVLHARSSEVASVSTRSFRNMANLRLLQIDGVHLNGSIEHFPKNLRWLRWRGYPSRTLSLNCQLDKLVALDMQYSKFKELDIKRLSKLEFLNLSYCKNLVKTPNFQGISNLESLECDGCTSLVEVHPSIGNLDKLFKLNLKGCDKLKWLPESIYALKSLKSLDITACQDLGKLPERLGDMVSLTELLADGTAIKELPSSIGDLKNLKRLSLKGCSLSGASSLSLRSLNSTILLPASFARLTSLKDLDLSYRGLSDGALSFDLGSLHSLRKLNLSGNNFVNLPSSIGSLPCLQKLLVAYCPNLLSISELPSSLLELYGFNCTSMGSVSLQSKIIPALLLGGCQQLIEIQGMEGVRNFMPILLDNCINLANNFKKSLIQSVCSGERCAIFLPGDEIPEYFSHRRDGCSLSFHVPAVSVGVLQGLVVWVVCTANEVGFVASANIKRKRNGIQLFKWSIALPFQKLCTNHSWVNRASFTRLPCPVNAGEELELFVETTTDNVTVEKCSVHLIVEKPDAIDSEGTGIQYGQATIYKELESFEELERIGIFNANLEIRVKKPLQLQLSPAFSRHLLFFTVCLFCFPLLFLICHSAFL